MLNLSVGKCCAYFASHIDNAISVMPDKNWAQAHIDYLTENFNFLGDYLRDIAPEEDRGLD